MLERIIALSIRFRWVVMALVLLACAVGVWSFQRLPIDATLYAGSVYLAPDEPQYLLFFRTACEGLSFLFDHIREPVPAIVELFADVEPADGDSRTNDVGPLEMKEGDLIATSIGIL